MIDRDWAVGATGIWHFFNRTRTIIEKIPATVVAKRGLLVSIRGTNGRALLALNGFVIAGLADDEHDLKGGRFHRLSDINFRIDHDVRIATNDLTGEKLDWMSESLLRPWGVRNVHFHMPPEENNGESKIDRRTYLSFERDKDAILFKLRWIG